MQWKNTETPTFAGSDGTRITGTDVVETMQLLDRNGNVVATFTKQVDGTFVFVPQGSLQGTHNSGTVEISSDEYSDDGSYQPVWSDLNLAAGAGTSEEGDSSYLAAMMGNVIGATLTKTKNIIAGLIGKLSVTGTRASTYPVAAVVGEVGDGVTAADGCFVGVLGGDSEVTTPRTVYGVDSQNSVPGSGFQYFLDAVGASHDGYTAISYSKAVFRLGMNGSESLIFAFGTATNDAGIVSQVGADNLISDGSLYISMVTGGSKLFQKQNDVWVDLQA